MKKRPCYSMKGRDSILMPADCGLTNGMITLNGWFTDVAAIHGFYAPPLYSNDFQLNIRWNGHRVSADDYTWSPEKLTRRGRCGTCRIVTELIPVSGKRAAVLRVRLKNRGSQAESIAVQLEATGKMTATDFWGFGKPTKAEVAHASWEQQTFFLSCPGGALGVASSLELKPKQPVCSGVLEAACPLELPAGKEVVFYVCLSMAPGNEASELLRQLLQAPETVCRQSLKEWTGRVKKLCQTMPQFEADTEDWNRLYDRSLLHLLLNEWNVPEFCLHPYYATGGMNGGCLGNYLWNYGEPYRLWSLLNPLAAKEHIKAFLSLDLTSCYAMNPMDGKGFGPYYPINQEKIVFLIEAYVSQTGDVGFLGETVGEHLIIEHVMMQAMMHDNLNEEAVLVDYGNGNHHLELRRALRYDGILPDLNLRRCITYHLAARLCQWAGVTPPVDFEERAEALKKRIRSTLFDADKGWYWAIDTEGKRYLRYTMQMFKAIGWGDWALSSEEEEALIAHLMNPAEFKGDFGIHSLSKCDPAYDEFDIDNGGPGACVSFTPAIIDRLYRCGHWDDAEKLLASIAWLAEDLPYWGDSQRADMREYRRDTPLQNDIEGAAIAQTLLFGMFGISIQPDFSLVICPHLPQKNNRIQLKNLNLAGYRISISCQREKGTTVLANGKQWNAPLGEEIHLPAVLKF